MNTVRIAATAIGVLGIIVGAIQATKPEALGISPIISAWLGVAGSVIAGVQMMLPPVHKG